MAVGVRKQVPKIPAGGLRLQMLASTEPEKAVKSIADRVATHIVLIYAAFLSSFVFQLGKDPRSLPADITAASKNFRSIRNGMTPI